MSGEVASADSSSPRAVPARPTRAPMTASSTHPDPRSAPLADGCWLAQAMSVSTVVWAIVTSPSTMALEAT